MLSLCRSLKFEEHTPSAPWGFEQGGRVRLRSDSEVHPAKAEVDHEMKKSFEFEGVLISYELKHAYSKRNRKDFIFCFITWVSCQSVIYIKPSPFRSWMAKFGTRKYQVSKSIHYKKHVHNACCMFIKKWRHRA